MWRTASNAAAQDAASRLLPGLALAAAAGAIAVLAALVVGLLLWRARARVVRRRPRLRRPRLPVVLAHGLLGFDELRIGRVRHDYFRGIPVRLERDGWAVHRARVARTAGIARRAAELAAFVEALPARRVHVIAHSMGGLDARYAISRLGLDRKVASLTTIGTPHLGTPVADLGTGFGELVVLRAALRRMGLDVDAFHDLTTARMDAFNREVPDVAGVVYASVVGVVRSRAAVNPLLVPTMRWLERTGGNDGLVPSRSQRWGEVVREIEADHFAQIGWSRHFDAAELYASLLRELG